MWAQEGTLAVWEYEEVVSNIDLGRGWSVSSFQRKEHLNTSKVSRSVGRELCGDVPMEAWQKRGICSIPTVLKVICCDWEVERVICVCVLYAFLGVPISAIVKTFGEDYRGYMIQGLVLRAQLLSRVQSLQLHKLYVALQLPLSVGFSRQEHWSGLPFPSPVQSLN